MAQLASIRQMTGQVSRGSAGDYQSDAALMRKGAFADIRLAYGKLKICYLAYLSCRMCKLRNVFLRYAHIIKFALEVRDDR